MNRTFKSVALAGALMVMAAPAFAQAGNMNPFGIDLDPFHIFTPAPPPPQVNIAPPMGRGMRMSHRMSHGRMMKRKPMMMMKKKMAMKKMMMKKKMK